MCVLWWKNLTACNVSASLGVFICQICIIKVNCFVDNGPKVHVTDVDEEDNYVLKYKIKVKNDIP